AEIKVAHVDLAAARASEYRDEAVALGEEVWAHLAALAESWEKLEAVAAAHRREATTVQRAGRGGLGGALQAAGLEVPKGAIRDLVSAIRTDPKRSAV
ncbi:MAG: hypothetical protein ACREMD_00930, partial [Gemmatimonadota bacterium]